MSSLDQAVRRGDPAVLMISGRGTVSVYPRQHCYVTDIQDWEGVYGVPREQVRIAAATWTTPPERAQPLEELQWRLAFHDAASGTQDCGAGRELLHLQSWPNLTRLPEEFIEPVTRMCALLWRKPTVGYLIARVLELPPERAARLVRVLQAFGHVNRPQPAMAADAAWSPAPPEPAQPIQLATPGPAPASVVSKFWQRLVGLRGA